MNLKVAKQGLRNHYEVSKTQEIKFSKNLSARCVCSIKETPTGDKEQLKQNVAFMIESLKKANREELRKGYLRSCVA